MSKHLYAYPVLDFEILKLIQHFFNGFIDLEQLNIPKKHALNESENC